MDARRRVVIALSTLWFGCAGISPAQDGGELPGADLADARDGAASLDSHDAAVEAQSIDAAVDADVDAATTTRCEHALDLTRVQHESAHNYILPIDVGSEGDTNAAPTRSTLDLLEDGVALGPAHSLHESIRASGAGRFSHWNNTIYFSTSDNSDPRTNGRHYSYVAPCHEVSPITLTKVADIQTNYGTFQSHNQKLLETADGIFMTYVVTRPDPAPSIWRLARSVDDGATFATIYESSAFATNPPTLEQDEMGSLFLFHADGTEGTGNAYFYRFDPANGFSQPITRVIPNGAAGKYTSFYDATRQWLYYMTWNRFFIVSRDGDVLLSQPFSVVGAHANGQYPLLTMSGATLYAAWTTATPTGYLYWDIHYLISDSGGLSWHVPGSTTLLALPIIADETGPSPSITLPDEFTVHTWLSSVIAKDDALHFAYLAQQPINRQHYVRVNPATGARDIDLQPTWKGLDVEVGGLDGFFSSDDHAPSRLYMTSRSANKVTVISSSDNGRTWIEEAQSGVAAASIYALTGARSLTSNGSILGHFTLTQGDNHSVWFFKVKVRR